LILGGWGVGGDGGGLSLRQTEQVASFGGFHNAPTNANTVRILPLSVEVRMGADRAMPHRGQSGRDAEWVGFSVAKSKAYA